MNNFYVCGLPDIPDDGEPPFETIGPFATMQEAYEWIEDTDYGNHATYSIRALDDPLNACRRIAPFADMEA